MHEWKTEPDRFQDSELENRRWKINLESEPAILETRKYSIRTRPVVIGTAADDRVMTGSTNAIHTVVESRGWPVQNPACGFVLLRKRTVRDTPKLDLTSYVNHFSTSTHQLLTWARDIRVPLTHERSDAEKWFTYEVKSSLCVSRTVRSSQNDETTGRIWSGQEGCVVVLLCYSFLRKYVVTHVFKKIGSPIWDSITVSYSLIKLFWELL